MKIRSLVTLLLGLFVLCSGKTQNADIDLLKKINPSNPNASFWKITSGSAFPVAVAVQGGMMGYDYFTNDSIRSSIVRKVATKLVVVVLAEGLKYAINRDRPYTRYPTDVHPYDATETGLSMPSAHTSVAFNTATALDIRFHKWYISVPAYLWAASVGYSRLYLGMHYPTDVLAGAALGIGSAYLTHWLDKKLAARKRIKKEEIK